MRFTARQLDVKSEESVHKHVETRCPPVLYGRLHKLVCSGVDGCVRDVVSVIQGLVATLALLAARI